MSFEQSLEYLLGWEGGYSNLAADPGGATNLGVIQSEYNAYRARKGLPQQSVRCITKTEASEIYKTEYWDLAKCDDFSPGVADALMDACVNSGVSRGVTWLQRAVNQIVGKTFVSVDGTSGPATAAAAKAVDASKLIDTMLDLRLEFMKVAKNPKTGALLWPTFGRGWNDRINGVRKQAHTLEGLQTPPKPLSQQEAKTMTTTIPAASPINANPDVAAVVNAALTPLKSIWSSITGILSSGAVVGLGGAFSILAPNLTTEILGGITIIAGFVTLVAHAYTFITGLSANNNATIVLAENLLNKFEQALGGKPLVFDNGPTQAASS